MTYDPSPDYLTKFGAETLARRIATYWLNRGRSVAVRVEKIADAETRKALFGAGGTAVYQVRSNIKLMCPRNG